MVSFSGMQSAAVMFFTVTLIVVVWEWLENPGGIFHNENGINWGFVLDTAISWLVPIFVYVLFFSPSVVEDFEPCSTNAAA